jgi:hypothetical protein
VCIRKGHVTRAFGPRTGKRRSQSDHSMIHEPDAEGGQRASPFWIISGRTGARRTSAADVHRHSHRSLLVPAH